ncbi:MAG: NAD(+)/NADH kinase [Deltaproteobacteria bacterium]
MKILLVNNRYREETFVMAEKLAEELTSLGVEVEMECQTEAPGSADVIMVLGGDGTILRAARQYGMDGVPLLGINMGTLGFLSNLKDSELEQYLQKLVKGDYIIDERMLLETRIYDGDDLIRTVYCLNEVVVRSRTPRMIIFEIIVSGQLMGRYRGDGVIIATPTGSTAYSLSAGGPVCDPALEAFLITPLAMHNVIKRPMVIHADNEIIINPVESEESVISLDGQIKMDFNATYKIQVVKADRKLKLVQLHPTPFFGTLEQRLRRIEEL